VPATVATAPKAKLKSDEWRTWGCLYLPVSFIRLWLKVDPVNEKESRRRDLMHLTMLLVSAIVIASSRVTSEENAREYLAYMLGYRQALEKLFPNYLCQSIHHMAMHIPEYLLMYGPVHGWWAYPFERMIGMLQRIAVNSKEGWLNLNGCCSF